MIRTFLSRQRFRWVPALGLAIIGGALFPLLSWAQAVDPVARDTFLSDPEFAEPRDPLLPDLAVTRSLSPLERLALEEALDQLALAAEEQYLAGQTNVAIQAWMREVRLRRILGYEQEIPAIGRVGLRVWESSRSQEVQLLTLRLRQIQADLLAQEPLDTTTLEAVAATFEVLRDIDSAIAVYNALITRAAQAGDTPQRRTFLEKLANLQESWFRFEVAGKTYQTLLSSLSSSQQLSLQRTQYLQGAIRNYEDAGQLQVAIGHQRQLLRQYQDTAQIQLIPALLLAIARNYRDLGEPEQARPYYEATYTVALPQNQSSLASDAVRDLAGIYLSLNKLEDVRYLYEQQIAVDGLSYNAYGIMQAFDKLGQLYERQDDLDAAITAYQEGLILASHLQYRDIHFKYRLQQLLRAQGRLSITAATEHQSLGPLGVVAPPDAWESN